MSNEVIEIKKEKHPIEKYWSLEQAKIIKNTIAPTLTSDEFVVFAHICTKVNLDPLAKQIYAIKRKNKKTGETTLCIQTSIDGFRLIAERTGKYSPGKDTEFLYDESGKLLGAKAYVKKMTSDGTWHDISATAFLNEYSSGYGMWATLPHVMIEKCAESRALRRAFPADLSGLYSDDEMDQAKEESLSMDQTTMIGEDKVLKIEMKTISEDQRAELEKYLDCNIQLRANMLNVLKSKYNKSYISEMPIELYEKALSVAKEAHEKIYHSRKEEVSA